MEHESCAINSAQSILKELRYIDKNALNDGEKEVLIGTERRILLMLAEKLAKKGDYDLALALVQEFEITSSGANVYDNRWRVISLITRAYI